MIIGITGHNGFIGSHLLKKIDAEEFKLRLFNGDLADTKALDAFTKDCEKVIHLAGIFSDDFDKLLNVNVLGTKNVVDSCKINGVRKIIFSSTGAVYGEPLHDGISKEEDSFFPNTLYGLSKLYAEEYINFSGLDFVILRFPNVYGPGNEKGVIYNFLKSIKENKKVTIFGSGNQKRDFLFVEDAVQSIILSLKYSKEKEIFNISSVIAHSLNDVVAIIKKKNVFFEVEYKSADENNALQILSEDITKAKEELNWQPLTSLEEGIDEIIKRFEIKK